MAKERPIIFNTEMVKAILDGRKSQTRRILKVPKNGRIKPGTVVHSNGVISICFDQSGCAEWKTLKCPYGKIGDRLWVRETFCLGEIVGADTSDGYPEDIYVSQCPEENSTIPKEYCLRHDIGIEDVIWKPSIFMFRKDSRIALEVTDIRVEKINQITDLDAIAEGIEWDDACPEGVSNGYCPGAFDRPSESFAYLWDFINAKRNGCSWIDNPWVWVIEFKEVFNG